MRTNRKEEQKIINEYIDMEYEKFMDYCTTYAGSPKPVRLRYCNARVFDIEKYYVLVSYNTVVAFINKENPIEVFDILRKVYGFTSTSSQHVNKFANDYAGMYRIVNTWRDI